MIFSTIADDPDAVDDNVPAFVVMDIKHGRRKKEEKKCWHSQSCLNGLFGSVIVVVVFLTMAMAFLQMTQLVGGWSGGRIGWLFGWSIVFLLGFRHSTASCSLCMSAFCC